MLLEKDNSCLLMIDVQEKLTPFVEEASNLIKRCEWLINLAQTMGVPIIVSEQYPKGLGTTVEPLHSLTSQNRAIEKVTFSSWREPAFREQLESLNRKQLILAGIETHVCVLQTAFDLLAAGFHVSIVVDAVSSRSEVDYKYALKRMKQAGIQLITSEMVFFEWVERAGTPEFKGLSKRFLQ